MFTLKPKLSVGQTLPVVIAIYDRLHWAFDVAKDAVNTS